MFLLSACQEPSTSSAPTGVHAETVAVTRAYADSTLPIGVIRIVQGVNENGCPESEVTMWGLYDRTPTQAVYGTEWEYWSTPEGECAAYASTPGGYCDAECPSGEFCTQEGECVPWPEHLDAGDIHVEGLQAPVVFERGSTGTYALTEEPPDELFAGDAVTVVADGGTLGAFAVDVPVPSPLDTTFDCEDIAYGDADVTVAWTADGTADRARMDASWYGHASAGGTAGPAEVICDEPDDGALFIPEGTVHPPGASAGYTVTVSRYTRRTVPLGAGAVWVEVGWSRFCGMVAESC